MEDILARVVITVFVLVGLKSLVFGQFWPWQYKDGKCPLCGAKRPAGR